MPIYNPTPAGGGSLGYLVYQALLSQAGGAVAPTATVLANTIGAITYGYAGAGSYFVASVGLFTANKTFCFVGSANDIQGTTPDFYIAELKWLNASQLNLNVYNEVGNTVDGFLLFPTPIEIRVYP